MTMQGWQPLSCDCGSQSFTAIQKLSYHETQGTSNKQEGWQCTGCGKRAPMAALVEKAKKLNLQKRMAEIEAQIG